jgi:hypothetical protein
VSVELKAKAAALVSGGTGGVERALSEATGALRREKCCPNDSKGGTLVYTHTKPETKKGNPGLQAPLQGLLISLLGTPRAWPFDQIHGQVSVAQFGDKVGWDYLPGAAFWAPDPVVMLTILHVGNAAVLCHDAI